jgi:hypothetical protein
MNSSSLQQRAELLGFSSVKAFKKECAPNFDFKGALHDHNSHKSTVINYPNYSITIESDEKIHELVCLLNKFKPTTSTTCQCDYFGYANIGFTLNGFQIFSNILLEAAIKRQQKSHPNLSENEIMDLVYELSIIQRFVFDTSEKQTQTNKLRLKTNICDGKNTWDQIIIWQFLTTDITAVYTELQDIFSYY